jgi:hypothetical protein
MTYVQMPMWGEPTPPAEDAGFPDLLFAPTAPPEPDPETSPEETRMELFHAEADGQYSFANEEPGEFHQAGRDLSEVCVMYGWPPQHVSVGQHCPHGLTEPQNEIIDYTQKGGHQ